MLAKEAVVVRDAVKLGISKEALLVHETLVEKGLETPMLQNGLSDEAKRQRIEHAMRDVMETLGLDLSDDSLSETPERIAKMYVDEIFSGLDYRKFPKITQIENKMQVGQPVQVSDISLTSTCEHHFVTIDGTATVAYIPKDTVIGLSKINRLVGFFAQRPQVQERLTQQVLVALQALTGTEDAPAATDSLERKTQKAIFAGIKQLINLRKEHAVFGQARAHILQTANQHCFVYCRVADDGQKLLVLCNFSEHPQTLQSNVLEVFDGEPATDLLTNHRIEKASDIHLAPYQQYWLLS